MLKLMCYCYSVKNFVTPVMMQLPSDTLAFKGISANCLYFVMSTGQAQILLYDFFGKQQLTLKLPINNLLHKLFTVSYESLAYVDQCNAKTIQVLDSSSGKLTSTIVHTNDVTNILFNNVGKA